MVAIRLAGEKPGVCPKACWFLNLLCESKMICWRTGVISTNSASSEQRSFHAFKKKFTNLFFNSSFGNCNSFYVSVFYARIFFRYNYENKKKKILIKKSLESFWSTYKTLTTCYVSPTSWTDSRITIRLKTFGNGGNKAQN